MSTYIDIDNNSCTFAKNNLKLKRVINCDVMEIRHCLNTKFDFIYCRHVIEHLINPTIFIEIIVKFLADNGILVIQFPNGNSLEYLAYPYSNIRSRFQNIQKTNNFSKLKVFWTMISGGILHGIDPPRHLWAITEEGIIKWTNNKKIICNVKSYHLGDLAYSPYHNKNKSLMVMIQDFFGHYILSQTNGGTHLVAIIRHNADYT